MLNVIQHNANCFTITTNKGQFLQSYNTIVAAKIFTADKVQVLQGQPQSKTTARHLYQWLNRDSKGFKQMVKEDKIEYVNKIDIE